MKSERISKFIFKAFALCTLFFNSHGAWASLNYAVQVVDPTNALGADKAGVLSNFDAAMQDWAQYIHGANNLVQLQIELEVTTNTATGRFSGTSQLVNFANSRDPSGNEIREYASTYKLRTGLDPKTSGPDIVIQIEPDFMRQYYWIDPNPLFRTDIVPVGKTDLITIFAHELGHAFGINGTLNRVTGSVPSNGIISVYDSMILQTSKSQAPVFSGKFADEENTTPLPITFFSILANVWAFHAGNQYWITVDPTANYYHYGRFSSVEDEDTDKSFSGLMVGAWVFPDYYQSGLRIHVTPLDVAVLKDLGIPTF